MTILVIGGDRIDSIRRELAAHGLDQVEHWGGRKPADAWRAIPARETRVVMVTDQLSHSVRYNFTLRAARFGLPVIYSCRSALELREKLAERHGHPARSEICRFNDGWAGRLNLLSFSY